MLETGRKFCKLASNRKQDDLASPNLRQSLIIWKIWWNSYSKAVQEQCVGICTGKILMSSNELIFL